MKTRTAEQNAKIAAFEAERHREAEQTRILAERQIQDAEPKAVELTVRAKAEKEAAEQQAAAIVELAEAEAQRANVLSNEQTTLMFKLALLQSLPAVIEKSVEPMKSIDGIKIIPAVHCQHWQSR